MNYTMITLNCLKLDTERLSYAKNHFDFFRVYRSLLKIEGDRNKFWNYIIIFSNKQHDSSFFENIHNKFGFNQNNIIRIEKLEITAGTFPRKQSSSNGKLDVIEFVNFPKKQLDTFRDINSSAMKYIIEKKNWCKEFISLGTKKVLHHNSYFPLWNQIHLINLTLGAPLLYKKDWEEYFTSCPTGLTTLQTFKNLCEIKPHFNRTLAKKLIF